MKLWSDSDGWIEVEDCQSIGSQSITRSEGWRYRGNYMTDAAPGWLGYPTVNESKASNPHPGEWAPKSRPGRPHSSMNRTRICHCGRKKVIDETRCIGCRMGRKPRKRAA